MRYGIVPIAGASAGVLGLDALLNPTITIDYTDHAKLGEKITSVNLELGDPSVLDRLMAGLPNVTLATMMVIAAVIIYKMSGSAPGRLFTKVTGRVRAAAFGYGLLGSFGILLAGAGQKQYFSHVHDPSMHVTWTGNTAFYFMILLGAIIGVLGDRLDDGAKAEDQLEEVI